MDLVKQISIKVHSLFATDQSYYAVQQDDGSYRTIAGLVNPNTVERSIRDEGSFGFYQKNLDSTIKWICYDFDILKKHLDKETYSKAKSELIRSLISFARSLNDLEIPYILENSGNRGFHIWIIFSEKVSYGAGYEVLNSILHKVNLIFDEDLIGIDLFPKTKRPSSGVGNAVKTPLSKHKKSDCYAYLIAKKEQINDCKSVNKLTEDFLKSQLDILNSFTCVSKAYLEDKLDILFDLSQDENYSHSRIKTIKVQRNGFTVDELFLHWKNTPPLELLRKKIVEDQLLSNEERKLVVGLLGNLKAKAVVDNFSHKILHDIFSKTHNYNQQTSEKAIKGLASFNFPSIIQIESILGLKFDVNLSVSELINTCIPKLVDFEDGTFDISIHDIEITRRAELNYIFQNDEAQSRLIINELSESKTDDLFSRVNALFDSPKQVNYYKHYRNEGDKIRQLISLDAPERILTSCVMKQLIYFFDILPSGNSHGYKPNKGFRGGYIFEPWLYLWIKFLSNISSTLEDPANKNYYIVKTDVSQFYNKVPHDNLKRMLLGGVNKRLDQSLGGLEGIYKERYTKFIDVIFDITKEITGNNRGLPQGPAYARYLAELYLDNIDSDFTQRINTGALHMYQRYVDDIFFVVETKEQAEQVLANLKADLERLGLAINQEKTVISRIGDFYAEFNRYRSQSKYAVDHISKDFEGATIHQKNFAVNEFMKLIESDTCNDDLSFIFSHLSGVTVLDSVKKEKVILALTDDIGRGSLYKNLFYFVFENSDNWVLMDEIKQFSKLQSEVLFSSAVTFLYNKEVDNIGDFNTFLEKLIAKSTITPFVNEHLAYLYLRFGTAIKLDEISPKTIVKCLRSFASIDGLTISSELIQYINTELNDIESLSKFVEVLYPLCASTGITKDDLHSLSLTYYAKFSPSNLKDSQSEIKSPLTVEKFYYLLCLFSLSSANSSTVLLKSIWERCTDLFNKYDIELGTHAIENWMIKLDDINIEHSKAMVIITSIVDGTLHRGVVDKKKIFERFHSVILVFITTSQVLSPDELKIVLKSLKDKADFYKWLIDRDHVRLFPKNKLWFENNIIKNGVICLKRNNEILIRRPSDEFFSKDFTGNEDNGYSEIIVEYIPTKLHSIKDVLRNRSVKKRLDILLEATHSSENTGVYPNIFCDEKILLKNSLNPFNSEMRVSNKLIFQTQDDIVNSYDNNLKYFISCFFKIVIDGDNLSKEMQRIDEKYIKNISSEIDLLYFIQKLSRQLDEIRGDENAFSYDVAIAAALYLSLDTLDCVPKIKTFVEQYHKFNKAHVDRHVYCVNSTLELKDSTPVALLESVEASLCLLQGESIPSLSLYLASDIGDYKAILKKIVAEFEGGDLDDITLDDFSRNYPNISLLEELITIGEHSFKFENSNIINPQTTSIHKLEQKHRVFINSSEYIYSYISNNSLYLLAIEDSISKVFLSIKERFNHYSLINNVFLSYPSLMITNDEILVLDSFDKAVENIAIHRDIYTKEAQNNLLTWLKALPRRFHQSIVTLIAAHEIMKKEDIERFLEYIDGCLKSFSDKNPFLIKRLGDFNGTHRVIYKDNKIGRQAEVLEPCKISKGAEQVTLIVDNIITGSQVIKAIKFYADYIGQDQNYFIYEGSEKELVSKIFKNIKVLNICTVLYADSAISKIQDECRSILNSFVEVNVVSGRNIGANALFSTTKKIGGKDKTEIKKLLGNKDNIEMLYACLDSPLKPKEQIIDIEQVNLIARYQSLPKKCFRFLHLGSKLNKDNSPFVRVSEKYENDDNLNV